MKIKITWSNGNKEYVEGGCDEAVTDKIREQLKNGSPNQTIYLGTPIHTVYFLKEARKVEILEK